MEFVYYFAGKKSSQIFWKVLVPKSCKIGSLSKIPIVFAQLSGVVWPILMINRFNMSEFTTFLAPTKIKVYILQYYRHQQMSSSISEHHEPLWCFTLSSYIRTCSIGLALNHRSPSAELKHVLPNQYRSSRAAWSIKDSVSGAPTPALPHVLAGIRLLC